jgi:hypothetical protein
LVGETDPSKLVTERQYDSLGRETLEKRPDGSQTTTTLAHEKVGETWRFSQRIATTGGANDETVFDSLGRPIQTFTYGATPAGQQPKRQEQVFQYDRLNGKLVKRSVLAAEDTLEAESISGAWVSRRSTRAAPQTRSPKAAVSDLGSPPLHVDHSSHPGLSNSLGFTKGAVNPTDLQFTRADSSFGGLGAEQKSQSIERSSIDCETFLRAPIVNKAPRSERPARAERGSNHRVRFQIDRVEITACRVTLIRENLDNDLDVGYSAKRDWTIVFRH